MAGDKLDDSSESAALWEIAQGVEAESGDRFFYSLVRNLATTLQCQYSFVSELSADRKSFRTLAVWGRGAFLENFEIPLAGTPCEAVLGGRTSHYPERLCELFPADKGLVAWQAESYSGVPLVDAGGTVMGHLAILDDKPMREGPRGIAVMRIFAARARVEIERLTIERALRESEKRYRDLYEAAPLPILTFDLDGRIVAANRRFLNWAHLSAEQAARLSYADFSVPEAIERRNELHRLILSGREIEEEIQVCPPAGSRCWIRLAQRPLLDSRARVIGVQASFIDITENRRADEAIRRSEQRYRDLYEAAPLPIVSVGLDEKLVDCNHRFLQWAGITREDIPRLSLQDFATPRTLSEIRAAHTRIIRGEELEIEGSIRIPGGERRWLKMAARPMRNREGQIEASQVICLDLTETRKAQEALRASEERFAQVLGSAMDAIVTFDASRKIELFNQAAEKTFRCSAQDILGQPLDRFLTAPLRGALAQIMGANQVARQPALWASGGLTARRSDGEEFAAEATLSQAEVRGQKLFTLILRDVDERRRAEEERRSLLQQNEYLQEEIRSVLNFDEIVGQSRILTETLEKVRLVAATDSSVLVLGETGTGKELIARAVHSNSSRKDRPLIKVNCAALPSGLIESELFGHEKGAFTGAGEKRIGRFELAHGGTIFLDEIGEMPPELQVKLLRVLQEHEIERIGGRDTIRVDVRVITATNRDLQSGVADGSFRRDLYYRLNVFPIRLPPLRERTDDIPLLVHFFARRYAGKIGRKISRIPRGAMDRLIAYRWPGNVRELENVIERAVILSPGPELEIAGELLPALQSRAGIPATGSQRQDISSRVGAQASDMSLTAMERSHILAALKQSKWKLEGPEGAARALNLNPSTLRSRMKKLGITRPATHDI